MKKLPHFALLFLTSLCLAEPPGLQTLSIGSKAPDFHLKNIDGKMHSLATYAGAKALVVIFMANHCPTAQAYEERMIDLVNTYKPQGVEIIAVSSNHPDAVRLDELGYTDLGDTFADMKIRAADMGYNFPYLYDGDKQEMVEAYGAKTTPHVYIFDKDRILQFNGRIDDSEDPAHVTTHDTRDAIEALLAGREVAVKTTRTFGCSIKWADKIPSAEAALARWNAETAEVTAVDLDEVKALIANDTDRLRLINIWATWCGPCVSEMPDLVEMHRMYRRRPFEMVTISLDNPGQQAEVVRVLNEHAASMTNYHYTGTNKYAFIEAVSDDWQGALPFTMLVRPGGEVVYSHMGAIDSHEVKRAIMDQIGRYFHSTL